MRLISNPLPVKEYFGPNNTIVIPITSYVNTNNRLTLIDKLSTEVSTLIPNLTKVFATYISNNIEYPLYRDSTTSVFGIIDREHYKGKLDEVKVSNGLNYLTVYTFSNPDTLVYIPLTSFSYASDKIVSMFEGFDNVVLLEYK